MELEQLDKFITRYVMMWHEPDPVRRRQIVSELWAEDGEDYTPKAAAHGIDEITERVTRAYEEWVAQKGYIFEPVGNTDSHHNVVKFFWRMLPKDGGTVASSGLDIFVMDEDGLIRVLYQFIEPNPVINSTHR